MPPAPMARLIRYFPASVVPTSPVDIRPPIYEGTWPAAPPQRDRASCVLRAACTCSYLPQNGFSESGVPLVGEPLLLQTPKGHVASVVQGQVFEVAAGRHVCG